MTLTARDRADRAVTGAELTTQILELARLCGWLACHQRPARTAHGWRSATEGDVGWPDVCAVRGGRMLAWEVKRQLEPVPPHQQRWLDALALVPGIDARVVRPSDFEWIQATLTSRRG